MVLPFGDRKFVILLIAVGIVVTLEILSLAGIEIPSPYAPVVFAAFILSAGYGVLRSGLKALLKLNFSSINLLMLIAVVAAFYLVEYPEAAVVIVLYVLGERLEIIGIENSKTALDSLISKSPKSATMKDGSTVAIDTIIVGTILIVKPGDLIPLDGRVVSGHTTVDESAITGEPVPRDKHQGDMVFAGTVNKNGYIEIESTRISSDTTFSKIIQLTFQAQAAKSKAQQFIQRFAKIYTPAILVIAALIFLVPVMILNQSADKWLLQAITLLVIACPCALVISTPVAIYAAVGNASARGALVKGGKYLELLADVKVMALDKTRTITFGKPVVSDVIPMHGTDKQELLSCAAGAELFSEHPLADAIVDASRKEGCEPHKVKKFESIAGKGTMAECLVCEDETIFVGKLSFIREHQPVTQEAEKIVERLSMEGKTSVVVSFGNGVAGIIGLMDEIKPGSMQVISKLKSLGIEPVILSGDNENAVRHVANQIGVKKFFGGMLPETKAGKIRELSAQYGNVVMVGDGINDAPALARASVGIAMGSAGSDTAIETANIALMNDNLSLIPFLVRLSRRTLRTIRINTAGAILIKVLFVFLAIMGFSNLALAIAADVGVTLVVILISLNLGRFKCEV